MNITLTQKETMLLQDQKSHEEICIEKYGLYSQQAKDDNLKQMLKGIEQAEKTHLDTINQLLAGTIPQMSGQSSQGNSQQNKMNPPSQGSQSAGSSQNQSNCPCLNDKDMCSDLLATEKYISGTYDTAVFEFKNSQVRNILNHIQKEEQQHGEALFNYMESHGMYSTQ